MQELPRPNDKVRKWRLVLPASRPGGRLGVLPLCVHCGMPVLPKDGLDAPDEPRHMHRECAGRQTLRH